MRGEISVLQAGRGLAALAVVLFHLNGVVFPRFLPGLATEIWAPFRGGEAGVDFFFVLSGFLMAHIHWSRRGLAGEAARFAWKRFLRIYPAYWLVAAPLAVVLLWLVPDLAQPHERGAAYITASLALFPTERHPVLDVAWTLQHEVLFYAVFGLALWRPRLGGLLLVGWLGASLIVPFTDPPWPVGFLFSGFHLLFAMGMAAAFLFRRGAVPLPGAIAAGGLIGFAVAWALLCVGERTVGLTWAFGLSAALAVLGLAEMERQGRLRFAGALAVLGDSSYSLYLLHMPVMAAGALALKASGLDLPVAVAFALLLGSALAAGFAFRLVVEKPILAMTRPRPKLAAAVAAG